jgi:hypothetical protein
MGRREFRISDCASDGMGERLGGLRKALQIAVTGRLPCGEGER